MDIQNVVAWLVILAVSGCLQSPPSDPAETGATTRPTDTTSAPVPGAVPRNESEPSEAELLVARYEKCRGLIGVSQIRMATARQIVPKAFEPVGLAPDTAFFDFIAMACAKAATNSTVASGVSSLLFRFEVEPKNKSWDKAGKDFFISEHLVQGIRVPHTANATFAFMNVSQNGQGLDRWSVRTETAMHEFEAPRTGIEGRVSTTTHNFWYGAGPFSRVTTTKVYAYDEIEQWSIAYRFSGTGPNQAALTESPVMPLGDIMYYQHDSYTFDQREVYAEG